MDDNQANENPPMSLLHSRLVVESSPNTSKDGALCTPRQTLQPGLDGDLIRSIDSGFSERTVFSSPGEETPVLQKAQGAQSDSTAIEQFGDNCFSPVSRLPNIPLRLRRLKHRPSVSRPPVMQLLSDPDSPSEPETVREKLNESEGQAGSASSLKAGAESEDTQFSVRPQKNVGESSSSSSLSSSTEELEFSMQEMSIDEGSSSNCDSPVFGIPLKRELYHKLPSFVSLSSKEFSASELDNTATKKPSILKVIDFDDKAKDSNINIPISESHQQGRPIVALNQPSCSNIVSPSSVYIKPSSAFTPNFQSSTDLSRLPATSHEMPPKSPLKRLSGSSLDGLASVSPTKSRKTSIETPSSELNIPGRTSFSQECKSPRKLALRSPKKIVTTPSPRKSPHIRSLFDEKSQPSTSKSPSLGKASFNLSSPSPKKCVSRTSFEKHSSTSPHKSLSHVRTLFDDQSSSSSSSSSLSSPPKTHVSSPIKSSPINRKKRTPRKSRDKAPANLSIIGTSGVVRSIFSDHVSELRSPLCGQQRFERLPSLITPNKHSLSKCRSTKSNMSPRKQRLEKIIKELSPREPSKLIGRHTGAGQLDIIRGLSAGGFINCLQLVFSNLADEDLLSCQRVSLGWAAAVAGDPRAVCRLDRLQALATHAAELAGKENTEKSKDSVTRKWTSSKGPLTSFQPQASRPSPTKRSPRKSPPLGWSAVRRACPSCQAPAAVLPRQDRAVCGACGYDFCTLCFSPRHPPHRRCQALAPATAPRHGLAGSRKSRKNLRRL